MSACYLCVYAGMYKCLCFIWEYVYRQFVLLFPFSIIFHIFYNQHILFNHVLFCSYSNGCMKKLVPIRKYSASYLPRLTGRHTKNRMLFKRSSPIEFVQRSLISHTLNRLQIQFKLHSMSSVGSKFFQTVFQVLYQIRNVLELPN